MQRSLAITRSALAFLLVLLLTTHTLADSVSATRGLASHLDVAYAPKLRSRADQSPTSPVLVRVSPIAEQPGSQRIEFIGAIAGTYDLRDFLERDDGRAITDLPPLPITVGSQLPADAGTDLYSSGSSWFNWAAHYRALLWTAVALWAAVPAAYWILRSMRKPAPTPLPPLAAPPPTVEEELRAAIAAASASSLSIDERAKLELLLFRYFGGQSAPEPASPDEIAALFHRVRASPDTRPLVVAVERWLHSRDGDASRAAAASALDDLRRTRLASAIPPGETLALGGAA